MRKMYSALLAAAMVLSLAACGSSANETKAPAAAENETTAAARADESQAKGETQAQGKTGAAEASGNGDSHTGTKLLAFSQGDNGNSWRVTNTDDMQAQAEARGYEFIWADAGADPSKQLSDIQDLLSRKPDILVVAPVQTEALTPCVDMASQAGVPLITIDRAVGADIGTGTYVAKIEQDFTEIGRQCGEYVAEFLTDKYGEPKGKVLEISGTVGASASIDQSNGIREVLKQYPDIEIVDSQSGDYSRATARSVMDDFLNKYPEGSVDFIISYNDEMSFGAMQAMEDAGRTDLLGAIVSKDGMRDALEAITEGRIYACVQCTPYFGETTMDLVEKVLKGESFESAISVPFTRFDMTVNKEATEKYYQYLVDNDMYY